MRKCEAAGWTEWNDLIRDNPPVFPPFEREAFLSLNFADIWTPCVLFRLIPFQFVRRKTVFSYYFFPLSVSIILSADFYTSRIISRFPTTILYKKETKAVLFKSGTAGDPSQTFIRRRNALLPVISIRPRPDIDVSCKSIADVGCTAVKLEKREKKKIGDRADTRIN
jgi:hypothetical protein